MIWKWASAAAAIIVLAAGSVYALGLRLPADHLAEAETLIPAPIDQVAATIRNVEAHPRWRPAVKHVEIRQRHGSSVSYVEHSTNGKIAFQLDEEVPGHRFRATITDQNLPFGGYWIIGLSSQADGTLVRIEEHGTVRNPIFRFVSKWIIGQDATIRAYLNDLKLASSDRSFRP